MISKAANNHQQFLRYGLSEYVQRNGDLQKNGLTLHDTGELIRRAGLASGFIVESEYKIYGIPGKKMAQKIDWVWLPSGSEHNIKKPIVAFEIEGIGVYPDSIKNDLMKLKYCGANINIILLFTVEHNRTPKKNPPYNKDPKVWVKEHFDEENDDIKIICDYELMEDGGIEALQKRARELFATVV